MVVFQINVLNFAFNWLPLETIKMLNERCILHSFKIILWEQRGDTECLKPRISCLGLYLEKRNIVW